MTLRTIRLTGIGFGIPVLAASVFLACGDSPAQPASNAVPDHVAYNQIQDKAKGPKPSQHFARVKDDGALVDGTATEASRLDEGVYSLKFPPPIDGCAAAANSAAFQGYSLSVFRVTAQIGIGVGQGGVFDDESVRVQFFSTSDGSRSDTSFTIILVCP